MWDLSHIMWYNKCKGNGRKPHKTLHLEDGMYKRKSNQVSIFDDSAMFGGIPLNPENEWVKLAKLIPWWVFEEKYADSFVGHRSAGGQSADGTGVADHQGKVSIFRRDDGSAHRDESVSAILRRAGRDSRRRSHFIQA